jgi:ubiquinone/menaquinone biosynthesis C-methylase UbiE
MTQLIRKLLVLFFHLLYHQFACMYDLVAATVSLGRWQGWVFTARPYLRGQVLEIGFGPGHLQAVLHGEGLVAFGLDESRQMGRQARRRLHRLKYPVRLVNGYAQYLPFPGNCFDSVAATFPSEYIFEPQVLAEIVRVLKPGGRLVVIPTAWITGQSRLERLAAGLFRITGQAGAIEAVMPGMKRRIEESGLAVSQELVEAGGSRVLVLVGEKR